VLDEDQYVQSSQQHGIRVQEVDREDPGGLGVQELPPGRAGPARCRIDTRGMQDLPHRGRRYGEAELRQLAVYPAVSPQRVLLRQPDDKAGDAPGCRRTAGLALLARVVLLRGQSAVPGKQRRWRHGEDLWPALPGQEPHQRREPHPVSRVVPDLADVAAEHRVLVPKHQQLSSLCPVTAEHQRSHTEDPAREQVDDLRSTRPANHHGDRPAGDRAGQPLGRVFERHTTEITSRGNRKPANTEAVPGQSPDQSPASQISQRNSVLYPDMSAAFSARRPSMVASAQVWREHRDGLATQPPSREHVYRDVRQRGS
jgi:hypothetical protein